jgi:hypothetical protein
MDWMRKRHTLVNIGKNTALGDRDVPEKLVQLFVVPDGKLQVAGDDSGLLVVTSGIASKLKNFGSEVLEDGSEVDGRTSTDTLGIVALAKQTVNTTNGESKTRLGGATGKGQRKIKTRKGLDSRLRVLGTAGLASGFTATSHFESFVEG